MKRLIAALATTAALLVPASGAQAATFIYPTLFPTATVFSMGWSAFPSGDPAAMLDNSRAVGFETPTLNQGVQSGLNMTVQVEHFTLPPGAKIKEWSVRLYGQAGITAEPGAVELSTYTTTAARPIVRTTLVDGPGWAIGTTPAEAFGPGGEWAACTRGNGWGDCVEGISWQKALDGMWLEIRLKKWSKANRAYEAFLQPKVEVP